MSGHTPGPWLVTGGTFVYALNSHGTNSFWANIYGGSQGGCKSPATQIEEIEANARLIAAAPDLMEALQSLVKSMRSPPTGPGMTHEFDIGKAERAIAKAKGQPQ